MVVIKNTECHYPYLCYGCHRTITAKHQCKKRKTWNKHFSYPSDQHGIVGQNLFSKESPWPVIGCWCDVFVCCSSGAARGSNALRMTVYRACHALVKRYVLATLDWEPPHAPRGTLAAMSYFYEVAADAGIIGLILTTYIPNSSSTNNICNPSSASSISKSSCASYLLNASSTGDIFNSFSTVERKGNLIFSGSTRVS